MEQKKKFIESEILTWSITAGLSRGTRVYKEGIEELDKKPSKEFLREEIPKRFGHSYHADSNTHIGNLRTLKEDIDKDKKCLSILDGQKIYFGRIQKIVNLYLKYCWVCFNDPKPVHCPFDRIILHDGLSLRNISWTSMTEDQYTEEVLTKAKEVAGGFEKITEWEIDFFNNANPTYLNV